jgi:UDP-N-acetylmuramyl pentapeptide phosphotransferase/UDP-N-acetylglucosamine-1-phosphate transferase
MLAVGLALATLPAELRALPAWVPLAAERAILFAGTLWFVNLTNFMDGMDGISAVETLAITSGIIVLAALGAVPPALGWWAAALAGAMAGFVPWNAPPARVFLGDAGSLPLGLLLAVLLVQTAAAGALAAALILAAYYAADATLTLARRAWRRARLWEPHRDHFYQQALRQGWQVRAVLRLIAVTNVGLLLIAVMVTLAGGIVPALVGLTLATVLTGATLWRLSLAPL